MKQFLLIIFLSVIQIMMYAQQENSAYLNTGNNSPNSLTEKKDLRIYPNPAKIQKVTLEMPLDEMAEIRLVNIAGKEILKKTFEFGVNKHQIDLYEVPNGIYLIQVKTINNKAVVKKLLVSRE